MKSESETQQSNNFEKYKHLRDFENNFNQMRDDIRKLASGWLLVTFGAVAYSYTLEPSKFNFPISAGLLSASSAMLGVIEIFTLWILDQKVYQNLIRAAFIEGCYLESMDKNLPQVRRMMMHNSKNQGMGRFLKLFYIIPLGVLALLILSIAFLDKKIIGNERLIISIYAISTICLIVAVHFFSRADYKNLSEGHWDPQIDSWFHNSSK